MLTNPRMEHTRELHIVSGELNILKRTLYPLYNMVNALRDYLPQKRIRRLDYQQLLVSDSGRNTPVQQDFHEHDVRLGGVQISNTSKLYLADVADHVLILSEEVDILRGTVDNLINMVSHPSVCNGRFSTLWLLLRVKRCASSRWLHLSSFLSHFLQDILV